MTAKPHKALEAANRSGHQHAWLWLASLLTLLSNCDGQSESTCPNGNCGTDAADAVGSGGQPQTSLGGAPTYGGSSGNTSSSSFGGNPIVCNPGSFCTNGAELLAPLPLDTALYSKMVYKLCFDGTCATLSNFAGGTGTSTMMTLAIPAKSFELAVTFEFESVKCSTECTGNRTQLHVYASTKLAYVLADGDVWKVAVVNADGTTYYEAAAVADYELMISGGGTEGYATCDQQCQSFSVPILPQTAAPVP